MSHPWRSDSPSKTYVDGVDATSIHCGEREIQECRQIMDAVTVQYDVSKVERPWSTCIIMRRIPGRVGVIAIIMDEKNDVNHEVLVE